MRPIVEKYYLSYFGPRTLNLGCAGAMEPRMINADLYSECDVRFDAREPWPFQDSLDTVYASHILEHFSGEEVLQVFWHMGEALKVGGHLVAVVPHGASELHFANPFHKQAWTLATLGHVDRRFHENDHMTQEAQLHSWELKEAFYLYNEHIPKELSFEDKLKIAGEQINAVKEMYFVMRLEER